MVSEIYIRVNMCYVVFFPSTAVSHATLISLHNGLTKLEVSHVSPWDPPAAACELSLFSSCLLAALSNLKPSMTKVSPSSSMLA